MVVGMFVFMLEGQDQALTDRLRILSISDEAPTNMYEQIGSFEFRPASPALALTWGGPLVPPARFGVRGMCVSHQYRLPRTIHTVRSP
jgi:hypothetical protein